LNAENSRELKLTGLTRNGTFLVENGEIKQPLENMRFTDSLLRCLKPSNVEAVSKERFASEPFFGSSSFIVPAVKLKSFTFTSHTGF